MKFRINVWCSFQPTSIKLQYLESVVTETLKFFLTVVAISEKKCIRRFVKLTNLIGYSKTEIFLYDIRKGKFGQWGNFQLIPLSYSTRIQWLQ